MRLPVCLITLAIVATAVVHASDASTPQYIDLTGRPVPPSFGTLEWALKQTAGRNVTALSEDPVLLMIEDFLTKEECASMIRLGVNDMKRSTGGLDRSITTSRTSSTAWVNSELVDNQRDRRMLHLIEARIAEITNLPMTNQEQFQLLRYEPGQYYMDHHDYLVEQVNMPCGPRVATFFMYLTDVEEGGGTYFSVIDKRVLPKQGRAVLWFNTLNNTMDIEARTRHAAETVIHGEKWGINKWIHSYDFVTPWRVGRTG